MRAQCTHSLGRMNFYAIQAGKLREEFLPMHFTGK